MITRRAVVLTLAASPMISARAAEMAPTEIEEWKVPWENSRPRDPYAESASRVWFVGQRGNYIANLNPETSEFSKIDLPEKALPHNVIVDQGIVWYAGNGDAHLGRIDPKTGVVEKIPMPDPAARDPHTLMADGKGGVWFTVQGGNFIGRIDTATRAIRLVKVPTAEARPYGIKIDSTGRVWVVEFGTNKLATVDATTFALSEIEIPRKGARRFGLVRRLRRGLPRPLRSQDQGLRGVVGAGRRRRAAIRHGVRCQRPAVVCRIRFETRALRRVRYRDQASGQPDRYPERRRRAAHAL